MQIFEKNKIARIAYFWQYEKGLGTMYVYYLYVLHIPWLSIIFESNYPNATEILGFARVHIPQNKTFK